MQLGTRYSTFRGPAPLYTAITVALLVALAAFGLGTRRPSPPKVAEVAPNSLTPGAQSEVALVGTENTSDQRALEAPLTSSDRPVTPAAVGPERPPAQSGDPPGPGPAAEGGSGAGAIGGGTGGSAGGEGGTGLPGSLGPGTGGGDTVAPAPNPPAGGQPASGTSPTTSLGPAPTTGPSETTTTVPSGDPGPTTTQPAPTTTTTSPPGSTTSTSTAPSTTTTTRPVPMVFATCTGGDRQIVEDPQSPPCISAGPDARGSGSRKGIVGDRIRIARPDNTQYGMGNDPAEIDKVWDALEQFVNNNFMLYGRQVEFVPYTARNPTMGPDPARAIADAELVNQENVFAALGYLYQIPGHHFFDRLADLGVVSTIGVVPTVEEDHFSLRHPYQWSYVPTLRQMEESLGEFICAQMRQVESPSFAGEPIKSRTSRHFGLVYNDFIDALVDVNPLLDTLRTRCGIQIATEDIWESSYKGTLLASAETTPIMAGLKQRGVTSVICICHANALRAGYQLAANQVDYHPEWILSSFLHNDFSTSLDGFNKQATIPRVEGPHDQMEHSITVSFRPKALPAEELPITRALKKGYGESFDWTVINKSADNSGTPPEWSAQMYNWMYWKPLLLLMSGIQMAGPNLTPETFAAGQPDAAFPGLQGTIFPNPDTGEFAGRVGFTGDHTMVDDATLLWWSWDHDTEDPWGTRVPRKDGDAFFYGAWCYADHGKRYGFTEWSGPPPSLYTGDCY